MNFNLHDSKLSIYSSIFLLLLFSIFSAHASALKSEKDRLSYTIGADIGENFRSKALRLIQSYFLSGMQDALNQKKMRLTKEEMTTTLKNFQKDMIKRRAEKLKKTAETNKTKGQQFLRKNSKKSSIKTTGSGLQYEVLQSGKGKRPSKSDTVSVRYKGTLIDGTVFDSTEKTGEPVTFKVTDVIKGWTEALQMMRPGARWKVYVPR